MTIIIAKYMFPHPTCLLYNKNLHESEPETVNIILIMTNKVNICYKSILYTIRQNERNIN